MKRGLLLLTLGLVAQPQSADLPCRRSRLAEEPGGLYGCPIAGNLGLLYVLVVAPTWCVTGDRGGIRILIGIAIALMRVNAVWQEERKRPTVESTSPHPSFGCGLLKVGRRQKRRLAATAAIAVRLSSLAWRLGPDSHAGQPASRGSRILM